MNVFKMPNGDTELADWAARKDPNWVNVAWIITHFCTMNCPYCVGWKKTEKIPPTLVDRYGVTGVIERFEKMRDMAKKNFYITISGGEPTLVKELPQLCAGLTKRKFVVELHTNLTTPNFKKWANYVDPKFIGQIMASYHGWRLDVSKKHQDLYLANFAYAMERDLTPVLKRIVLPTEVPQLEDTIGKLEKLLPENSPMLFWGFIRGAPRNATEWGRAYPYAYTKEEKETLNRLRKYRMLCQRMYHDGGGFYKGMKCDAGRGFFYMNIDGKMTQCFPQRRGRTIGNFAEGKLTLNSCPQPCPLPYCGTPFWGAWFGENPWDYVQGFTREECTFNRFGPWEGPLPTYPGFQK